MSKQREFSPVNDQQEGRTRTVFRVYCCRCRATSTVSNGMSREQPHNKIQQKLEQRGWYIDATPAGDRCPDHAAKIAKPTAIAEQLSPIKDAIIMPSTSRLEAEAPMPAPRTMQLADRRLIIARLSDVYGDSRYTAPWTDESVAVDMGVPRSWVELIRDENFGPAGSNPEIDAALTEARTLCADMAKLIENWSTINDQIMAKSDALDRLGRKIDAIAKAVKA